VSVTVRDGDTQVEIQLGHFCNNRCVFCVSGQLTEQGLAPKIDTGPIFTALEAAAARGATRLTFLGGEPTIQPSFLPSLKRAIELGFDDITIFTNGVRTWKTGFMEEVVALGRFTWRFSIQGGDEATHDEVVGRKGAFERIRRGLAWLQARDQDVTANLCVNALSYRSLPKYAALLTGFGVRQFHVDVVRPDNAGVRTDEHFRRILVRFTDMAEPFDAMLRAFEAIDPLYDVNVGNLPFCTLPTWAWRIQHGGEATATVATDGAGRLGRVWDKYAHQREGMVYGGRCGECAFRDVCRGVPETYARLFGVDELVPLPPAVRFEADRRRDGLRQRRADAAARNLAKIAARAKRLRTAGPFAGWRWAGIVRADPALRVTFRGPDQAWFVLVLGNRTARFEVGDRTTAEEARPAIEAVAEALGRA
jgi:MoaA/NifB/PqqE/SkfB family radical SAM enzyme